MARIKETSVADSTMVKVDEHTPIEGNTPGTSMKRNESLYFEGLGYLEDFPTAVEAVKGEGIGAWCVVLNDFVATVDGPLLKGQVVRLSRLVQNYEKADSFVKSQVRRLFELNAIRQALDEEVEEAKANGGKIVFRADTTVSMQDEIQKRVAVEHENKLLKEKLEQAGISMERLSVTDPNAPELGGKGERDVNVKEDGFEDL